ncbi:MAG: hypothetical protein KDE33_13150 [Bacteroidetes bacterium]|nr:hypothetical protein [Bacteroidota bacterium]MCB9225767.1 hypothetical protein [Chitinophagales bacterium]
MKKLILILTVALFTFTAKAQEKYAEGYFKVQKVDESFFEEKILTDSQRNKDIIAENMQYYNKMIKAYNEKNYKDAIKWAREAFLGSIGEKIQFKVYQEKFEYAHELMEDQKLILFISLMETNGKIDEIQDILDYSRERLSEDRLTYMKKRAAKYNETAKKKIEIEKTYDYE